MNVQVSVSGWRDADGEREPLAFLAQGTFEPTEEGGLIVYQDPNDGMTGVITAVTVENGRVTVEHRGAMQSRLTVESGKSYACRYDTGYGVFPMEIRGGEIHNHLREHPKIVAFSYSLSINGALSDHFMQLELRPTIG